MSKYLLVFILLLSSFGLYAQKDSEDLLIPKDKIGVHGRDFKLDGFYYSKHMRITSEKDTIKYIAPLIFFNNGHTKEFDYIGNSSITLYRKKNEIKCKLKTRQDYNTILEFMKCYAAIVEIEKIHSVYSIDKNVIRIQGISLEHNYFGESRGVVYDDSTFVITKSINYVTNEVIEKNEIYHFQPSQKPDSTKLKPTPDIKKYYFRN